MIDVAIRSRHPLREPAFARLWVSGLLTETGKWVLQLALPLYVLSLTGSALVTSVVAMLGLLPSPVVAPLAGTLVDRFDRRRLLVTIGVLQAAALVPLLFVRDERDLWVIYAVVACEAALTVSFESVKNVALSTFVAPEQLVSANAAIGLNVSLGRLVGSPLGGLLIGWTGLRLTLSTAMAFFLIAAALALSIPRQTQPPSRGDDDTDSFWKGFSTALCLVRTTPTLLRTMICVALLAVAQGLFVVLFLLFVTGLLGQGESEAGLLRGVQAVGGFIGAATIGLLTRRFATSHVLSVGVTSFALVSVLTWNLSLASTHIPLHAVMFMLAGIPAVWLAAAWLSLLQQGSPLAVRGRVMACVLGLSDGLQALGMLAAGLLSGALGPLAALNVQGTVLLLASIAAFHLSRAHRAPTPQKKAVDAL